MTFLWLLEGIRTPFLDKLMQFITYFGQELIIIAVICALYWCADKRFAYLLGFTYFTAGLCVQSLKITFRIPMVGHFFPWSRNVQKPSEIYLFPAEFTDYLVCSLPIAVGSFQQCIVDIGTRLPHSFCFFYQPLHGISRGNVFATP